MQRFLEVPFSSALLETTLMISRVWVPGHVSGTDSCHLGGWREAFITLKEDAGPFCQVGGHLYAPI